VPPVGVFAFLAGDVAFRKTGDARGEIARFADEFDKLRGEFKAAGCWQEFAAAGRIAAQGEDVLAAKRADFLEQNTHLVARVVDAGEMGQRGQPVPPLDAIHDFQRFVARGAAGAVGDGAKIRTGFHQRGNVPFQKVAVALAGLGREKFKGDDRLPRRPFCRVNVANELHLDGGLLAEARAKPSFVVGAEVTRLKLILPKLSRMSLLTSAPTKL